MAFLAPAAIQKPKCGLDFIDTIEIRHGPRQLLGQFFLLVDKALQDRGLRFERTSCEELIAINEENRSTWLPLTPTFDTRLNPLTADNSFCFIGRNSHGTIVTTQAGRIFNWSRSSLCDAATTLSLFYSDPKKSMQNGEHCWVSTPAAQSISGTVLYTGGMWYHPDYRNLGLASYLGRLARAYALSQWPIDYATSLMTAKIIAAGTARRFGHTNLDYGVHSRSSTIGDIDYTIGWSPASAIGGTIAEFLAAHHNTLIENSDGKQPLSAAISR